MVWASDEPKNSKTPSRKSYGEFNFKHGASNETVLDQGVYVIDSSTTDFVNFIRDVSGGVKYLNVSRIVVLYHFLTNDLKVKMEKALEGSKLKVDFLKITYGLTKYMFRDSREAEMMGSQFASEVFASTGALDHSMFVMLGYGFLILNDRHGSNHIITLEFWKSLISSFEALNTTNYTMLFDKEPPDEIVETVRQFTTGVVALDSEADEINVRVAVYDR